MLRCRDIRTGRHGFLALHLAFRDRVQAGGGCFPASPVQEPILTEDDRRALGLRAEAMIVVLCAGLYDLAADAWEEAGGYQFSRPVDFGAQVLRSPSDRQVWIDRVYSVRCGTGRHVAGPPPSRRAAAREAGDGLGQISRRLPQRGHERVNRLGRHPGGGERPGRGRTSSLVAPLPTVHRLCRGGRNRPTGVLPACRSAGRRLGFDDEDRTLPDQPEAARLLARLLAGWDDFHPAAEWLFRNLALWQVTVGDSNRPLNLDIGEHFAAAGPVLIISGNRDPQRLAARRAAERFVRDSAFRKYGSQSGLEIPMILVEVADLPEAARLALRFYKEWDEYGSWSSAVAYRPNTALGIGVSGHGLHRKRWRGRGLLRNRDSYGGPELTWRGSLSGRICKPSASSW